ncbi:MAG: ABC transporter permease [Anaerolineaceae bacterium]|nr:MAG: ABC transporter permease [Anaerolineaceae bacterium]
MIQIIIKETKEFLREISNVFFYLIFPVVLVFLLGNLLSKLDAPEEAIGEVKIHYMIETEAIADIMSIEGFIQGVSDEQNIIFEKSEDINTSKALVGEDKITSVIIFTNSPLEIQIFEGTNRIKNRTINAMMNGFSQINKAVNVIVESNPKALMNLGDKEADFIKQKDLGINRTMLDYYAITMMSMISFMSIMLGAMCFMGERQYKTIDRLKIAPISQVKLFLSKILGLLPQVIIQISILMILSVFVFGANYASNFLDNLYLFFMFFVLTFTIIIIGAVYGLFVYAHPMATLMPVIWIMMFISGTYSKALFIDGVTQVMPAYKVQEAAFDLAIFGRYDKANLVIVVCIIISLTMLVIGAMSFRRRVDE